MDEQVAKKRPRRRFRKTVEFPKIKLNGLQKAAIFLQTLDSDAVKEILKHLDRSDVEKISRYLNQTSSLTNEDVLLTLREFKQQSKNIFATSDSHEKMAFFLDAYDEVSGVSKFKPAKKGKLSNLKAIPKIPAEEVAEIFKDDHNQVFALILSQLSPKVSTEILSFVEPEKKNDLLQRIATLKNVNPAVLETIDKALEPTIKKFLDVGDKSSGALIAADILGMLDEEETNEFFEKVKQTQAELYESIKKHYVGFSDIIALESDTLQKILAEVENEVLAKAICKSTQETKDKCFSVITKRAVTLIESEMNALENALPVVVHDAQQSVIKTARKLASENKIILGKD